MRLQSTVELPMKEWWKTNDKVICFIQYTTASLLLLRGVTYKQHSIPKWYPNNVCNVNGSEGGRAIPDPNCKLTRKWGGVEEGNGNCKGCYIWISNRNSCHCIDPPSFYFLLYSLLRAPDICTLHRHWTMCVKRRRWSWWRIRPLFIFTSPIL